MSYSNRVHHQIVIVVHQTHRCRAFVRRGLPADSVAWWGRRIVNKSVDGDIHLKSAKLSSGSIGSDPVTADCHRVDEVQSAAVPAAIANNSWPLPPLSPVFYRHLETVSCSDRLILAFVSSAPRIQITTVELCSSFTLKSIALVKKLTGINFYLRTVTFDVLTTDAMELLVVQWFICSALVCLCLFERVAIRLSLVDPTAIVYYHTSR